MKNRITGILLCLIIILTFACGCGEEKKATVYYLNFKPESAKIYDEIAKVYEQETGVKLKVVTAAANTYEQTLKSEIAKKDPPTIFQINGPVGYKNWQNYCADLKDTRLYSFLSDKSLAIKDGDGVYGIPYVVEGYGIIYNAAVTDRYFALPNRQTEINSMDEVVNLSKLKTICEDMTRHKEELNIEGVFASTSLLSGEDWRWQTHLLNIPLYYEFKEKTLYSDPTVAGLSSDEIAFKYSENYKNIFDLYLLNSVSKSGVLGSKSVADSMAEFALGKAAMVQNGNWAWSQIEGVAANTVKKRDIKFLPIYIGVDGEEKQGLCVGTENYLAINSTVDQEKQKAAQDFLVWLFSSETGKKFVTEKLNFITPFNTFEESELPDDPLAKELSHWLSKDSVESVPWVFTSFPGENFKKQFGSSLLEYAQNNKDWATVETDLKNSWKAER